MKYKYIILSIVVLVIPITIFLIQSSHAESTTTELTAQNHAEWDVSLYNPGKPISNDDVLLPMPCGGKMAFRKVETEAD